MKIIREGDKKIVKLIAVKESDESAQYRLSDFTFMYSGDNVFLMLNTMSGQVIQLTDKEHAAVCSIDNPVAGRYITENGLELLVKNRFIVETDYSEQDKYLTVTELLRMMDGKKGIKGYTILPTSGCNARCTYCYEADFIPRTMTQETADKVIEYIMRTRAEDKITLSWFGGEPLAGHRIISYICRRLTENGVEFRSTIVTNASLLTEEMAHEAKQIWHLRNAQVSLDGERSDYEARKRFADPKRHNYDRVMQSVHMLADRDISVNLRCNYDWENLPRLQQFIDDIKEEFGDMKNISLYFATLFQENEKPDCIELMKKKYELFDYCRKKGINISDSKKRESDYHMKINYCMADSLDRSRLIDPQGKLFDCEHFPRSSYGSVSGETDDDYLRELSEPHEIAQQCSHCTFLPYCTPFYIKGCPGWFSKCRESRELSTKYSLQKAAGLLSHS